MRYSSRRQDSPLPWIAAAGGGLIAIGWLVKDLPDPQVNAAGPWLITAGVLSLVAAAAVAWSPTGGGVVATGLWLVAGGWFIGPFVVSFVSNGKFEIDGWLVAVIVLSAGLTAAMCTTGPALVAARRHSANLAGWATAALLTVTALIMPWPQEVRVPLALIVPVVVGLMIHALALAKKTRAQSAQ